MDKNTLSFLYYLLLYHFLSFKLIKSLLILLAFNFHLIYIYNIYTSIQYIKGKGEKNIKNAKYANYIIISIIYKTNYLNKERKITQL